MEYGPGTTFCLACHGKQDIYLIGFVSYFVLYRRETSMQDTPTGSKRDNSPHNDDVNDVSVLLESELIGPV